MVPSDQGSQQPVSVGAVLDGTITVTVSGILDLVTADAAGEHLLEVVRQESAAVVALDLGAVEFCDCAGLAVLVRAQAAARRLGRRVVISAVAPEVAWLLHTTGLAEVLGCPTDGAERPTVRSATVMSRSSATRGAVIAAQTGRAFIATQTSSDGHGHGMERGGVTEPGPDGGVAGSSG